MAHPAGTKLARVCTVSDRFIVPFNIKAFANHHDAAMTELMRRIGMPAANMNNWQSMLKGRIPFSVAKALVLTYAPAEIETWEHSIQGTVEQKKPPCKVTEECAAIATQYDAKRAGAKFKLKDGSTLTIASSAADAVALRAREDENARLEQAQRDSERALEEQRHADAQRIATEQERVANLPRQRIEVNTARGPVTIDMPAEIPQGEREIYTGLILRLHHERTVAVREKGVLELRMKGLEGQIDNLKARLREVMTNARELETLSTKVDVAQATTIHGVTTPRIASDRDFDAVKERIKVPELQTLIEDMQKGMNGSFRKGAAPIS